jgi:Protein of unknown function (DUF4231)
MPGAKETIPVPEEVREHPAWFRLNDQLGWYDRKSVTNYKRYTWIKAAQLVLAGSVPIFALVNRSWAHLIAAILGASVAILEGVQQLGQYHDLWISYRSTEEHLKHEKYLFLAGSGPYRDLQTKDALKLLAERVEEQVSTEHTRWVSEAQQAGQQKQG